MEFEVEHPRFVRRKLLLRMPLFTSPKLVLDGQTVPLKRRKGSATDDNGAEAKLKLKAGLFEPVFKVNIDADAVEVGPTLPVYAYVFSAIPLVLMVAGGALGGAFGGMAWAANMVAFRADMHIALKLVVCVATTLFAGLAYVIAVLLLQILLS